MNMQTHRTPSPNNRNMSHARDIHNRQTSANASARGGIDQPCHQAEHDHHDDGLVHGHFWAMTSTVR